MEYHGLIVDADGVVNDGRLLSLESHGISSDRMQPFFRDAFPDCLIGKSDLRDALAPYLAEWGWNRTIDELLELWFHYGNVVNQDVVSAIRTLRQAGVPVYLATNQERRRLGFMREQMGYESLFDGIFASAELGKKKPEPEFFAAMLEALPHPEGSAWIFWDDLQQNVDVAKECGIDARLFMDANSFRKQTGEAFGIAL